MGVVMELEIGDQIKCSVAKEGPYIGRGTLVGLHLQASGVGCQGPGNSLNHDSSDMPLADTTEVVGTQGGSES